MLSGIFSTESPKMTENPVPEVPAFIKASLTLSQDTALNLSDESEMQSLNAYIPIRMIDGGISTLSRDLQLLNASLPIVVTAGITTEGNEEQLWNE
jgi:hypothetical protein